jgi:hypothetical protein
MNKITLALGAVIAITATLALTTMSSVMTQQSSAVGTNSTLSPCALAALRSTAGNSTNSTAGNSTNSTAGNSTNSTAGNSSHIVKSDLLFSGNNIVKIAANNPTQEPISSHPPCPHARGGYVAGMG